MLAIIGALLGLAGLTWLEEWLRWKVMGRIRSDYVSEAWLKEHVWREHSESAIRRQER